jgi:hypothetical protein
MRSKRTTMNERANDMFLILSEHFVAAFVLSPLPVDRHRYLLQYVFSSPLVSAISCAYFD